MMIFFNKQKGKEEFGSLYSERSSKGKEKPSSKDFRDLKPENRAKRREPKKPWGRKERIFVLIILVATTSTSLFLALSSYSWKIPGIPRISLSRLSLPFFGKEIIVLQGEQKKENKSEKIINAFKQKTKNLSGVYGLYVLDLEKGFAFGVNEDETFPAASLIKLPAMAAIYLESERGNLNLDEKYKLSNSDKVAGSGSLYGKPAGYEITYRNLVRLMGKESDNTSFRISRKVLGDERINEVISRSGMINTSLKENKTTPRDIGTFFESLWNGNIVSMTSRDEILESLTDTIYENHLAAGIPEDIRIAHKYGREVHVVNDAGIIFTEEPFIVVIVSKGVVEKEADKVFPELARMIYEIEVAD